MKAPKLSAIILCLLAMVIASGITFAATSDDIIIYSLGFVRLNAQATAAVKAQVSLTNPDSAEEGWEVYSSPELVKVVQATQPQLAAQLDGELTNRKDSALYRSWLASASTDPVSVRLEESIFTGSEYVDKVLANFELSLAPLKLNQDSCEVLTQIDLKYQSPTGEFSEANSTVWLNEQAANPIMVVSKKITGSKQSETEFFAFCAGVSTVPAAELPASAQVLSYGDIEGIREFISTTIEPTPRYDVEIGLVYSNPQTSVKAKVDRFYGDRHCYLAVDNEQAEVNASLGFDLPIQSTLRFATDLQAIHEDSTEFALRSGLFDKTDLGSLHLEAACYLINMNFGDEMDFKYPHVELSAAFSQPRWSVWYTGEFATGLSSQQSGIDLLLTSQLTIQASYCFDEVKAEKYAIGLFYLFTK